MTVRTAVGSTPGTLFRRERLKTDPAYQALWLALTLARLARAFPGEDLIGSRDQVSPR